MNNISIALCTYNGGAFLPEQLKSIAGQSLKPCELVACDDGSTDDTVAILEDFARRAAFPVRIYRNQERLGPVQNFARAVSLCRGDYVALCDQDDIWDAEKLALSSQAMRKAQEQHGAAKPLLLHTDLMVIDAEGHLVASSLMQIQKIAHAAQEPLKTLLVQNFVTGCTVLVNRPLLEAALPVPEEALMHDWWFALIAASLGDLIFLPRPTVHYRQHGRNTVGAKKFFGGKNVARLARVTQLEQMIASTIVQDLALHERLVQLHQRVPAYLAGFLQAARQGGKEAASYARRCGIAKQGRLRNMLFLLLLLRAGYLKYLEDLK